MSKLIGQEKQIASEIASGQTITQIASNHNVSRQAIMRQRDKPEIQEMIKAEREEFLKCIPKARLNIESGINSYESLKDQSREKERAWRASMEVLRGAGMLPSKESSISVNQYISAPHSQILSPDILRLLQGSHGDVIDVSSS
jgi:hypothetical protein